MKRLSNKIYKLFFYIPLLCIASACNVSHVEQLELDEVAKNVPIAEKEIVLDIQDGQVANEKNIKTEDAQLEKYLELSSSNVTLDIDSGGRSFPFVPYQERNLTYSSLSFGDLPLPPMSGEMDEALSSLITAKVTGIVYDEASPSAIIHVLDEDYLVKPGDKVEAFLIENIQKDYVAIRTGQNIFRAKVGDIVDGELYGTGVYNLGHRFAGIKNPSKEEDIVIVKTKKTAKQKNKEPLGLTDLELPPIPIQFNEKGVKVPVDSTIPSPI